MSVLDRFRLEGKRLFITGGSRGLGRAMALAIADAGADVILVGREKATLERTAVEAARQTMLNVTATGRMNSRMGGSSGWWGRFEVAMSVTGGRLRSSASLRCVK